MEENNYPNLYQSANRASKKTQGFYMWSIRIYLFLIILGGVLTQFAPKEVSWKVVAAVLLLVTLGISIFQALKRYDVIWYNGRAVAESVKTRTWRFIMQAEPYEDSISFHIAKKTFIGDIGEILKSNKSIGEYLEDDSSSNCISDEMVRIRALDLEGRKQYYKINRIDEQRKWYATKASWNKKQSAIWFFMMLAANMLAVIFIVIQIVDPTNESFPIEPLLIVASSILTWIQVKRFQDLSTSYNLTAHEITIIRQMSDVVDSEKEFSNFVKDAENAFSREHTQWVARKDK